MTVASKMRMLEDRALRDAAQALVKADVAHLKSDFSAKSLGSRALARVGDGTEELVEIGKDAAKKHGGWFALGAAAVALWFFREPIVSLFDDTDPEADPAADDIKGETQEPTARSRRSGGNEINGV
ncbi:hypothetical protein [Qipengyuania sp. JC766]|uniref:hypothetical protein n=1 Tax=Qipengyuania sp. JC766 TaxID=3232139 RepID=UPI003458B9BD